MSLTRQLNVTRRRRAARIRSRVRGSATKPRLSVYRSNKFTYVQLIDDEGQKTLFSASTRDPKKAPTKKHESALQLGARVAEGAKKLGIVHAVFDKGRYRYHGRVSAVADGARKGGLKI